MLTAGVYGLSNLQLDTPWPKVQRLKERLGEAMASAGGVDELATQLFDALADRGIAPDDALPQTGIPLEWERQLSPAFIRTPDLAYGTRCSTLIITERVGRHPVTHVLERTYTAGAGVASLRRASLRQWPPRYTDEPSQAPHEQAMVSEAELATAGEAPPPPVKRTRVHSLLKPMTGGRRRTSRFGEL